MMSDDRLKTLQDKISYHFKDLHWLERAMTHSSTGDNYNYERLEFLGDRVLGLVMAAELFKTFPKEREGGLAKRHSALVQGRTLTKIAIEHDLGAHIIMSESERAGGGEKNNNILSDAMEALLGAIYIDGGLQPAQDFILNFWGDTIKTLEDAPTDPKTALQEWAQGSGRPLPLYTMTNREGPDHAPLFTVSVSVEGYPAVSATGTSRRAAEKKAAEALLKQLKNE